MKAKNIGSNRTLVVQAILTALVLVSQVQANVGGGGIPITPYPRGSQVTLQQVTKMRQKANLTRSVEYVSIVGTHVQKSGYEVGLGYVKDRVVGEPAFKFQGVDEQNHELEVEFADVTSFRLLQVDRKLFGKDEAVLEVTVFPTLTPEQLLAEKPTYSTLLKVHKRIVRLRVMLQKGSSELCMLGTSLRKNSYKVVFRIRDLEPGTEVKLDRGNQRSLEGLWWAIQSVTDDPEYPERDQRFVMAK